jgi:hypothetical protein
MQRTPSPVLSFRAPVHPPTRSASHGFSYDMALRSVLDTIVCADIAGMEMQEDA